MTSDELDAPEETSEQTRNQSQQTNEKKKDLFARLREKIIEHANGPFLKLKDGQSAVITVLVRDSPNPVEESPREELVKNPYAPNDPPRWMLRLDCIFCETEKIYYVTEKYIPQVVDMIGNGTRKIRITRKGNDKKTEYTYEALD